MTINTKQTENDWNEVKLNDVVSFIIDNRGKNPPRYTDYGIPVIDNFQITGKRSVSIDESKRFIDEEIFQTFIRKYIQKNDVLITLVGNGYGNVALAPQDKSVIIQNTIGIRCGDECLNEFLFYFLILNKRLVENLDRGAAQPSVKVSDLMKIEFSLPQLKIQKNIVMLLSTYDNLIEINEKRIKVLEEMARLLYREWFVEFRFPGYEKVKMIDSSTEYGIIPEGWVVTKFGHLFDVKYGKNLSIEKISSSGKYKVYGAGGVIGYYDQKNINDKTSLVTCRGNGSGTVWRTFGEGFITNNSFTITGKDNEIAFEFVYSCLQNSNISSTISGSAQPQITVGSINFVKLILPPKDLIKLYIIKTKSLYVLADELRRINKNLSETRDLLLPKLMSGEIDVNNLDIKVVEN